jgi:UDP-N-acetyl-D-glucosamine dehydrogenase
VNGSTVLVLGITYKRDIDDLRESPALDVMHLLQQRGASVAYADPHAPVLHAREWPGKTELRSVDLSRDEIARYDCAVVLTDHQAFDYDLIVESSQLLVDTRNALGAREAAHIFRLGAPGRQTDTTSREEIAA